MNVQAREEEREQERGDGPAGWVYGVASIREWGRMGVGRSMAGEGRCEGRMRKRG